MEDVNVEYAGDGRTRAPAASPRSPEEARRAIESTRGRISEDLDAIEARIVEKKAELQDRMDVLRPVRERVRSNPLPALGVALAVGLVLGLLSGGDEEEERERRRLDEEERAELRRWRRERRARLLAREAREAGDAGGGEHAEKARGREREDESLSLAQIGQALSGAVTGAVAAGLKDRLQRMLLESRTPAPPPPVH